jgi:hypothetical protein
MLMNLLLGLPMMALCLLLQSLLFIAAMHYYAGHEYLVRSPSFAASLLVVNTVMLLLVVGNLVQIALWAGLFQVVGEFQQFDAAFYHSAVNFATLGYGDIVMSEKHRLLGPLESVNGVLMIGVSTAALMAAFQDALRKTIQARHR